MKRISASIAIGVLGMSLFGAAACSGAGGSGCGPTEEELDAQATSATQTNRVTCGPGTHLDGNTCVRNTVQTQSVTTLGGGN
jgi:hypothetical protein